MLRTIVGRGRLGKNTRGARYRATWPDQTRNGVECVFLLLLLLLFKHSLYFPVAYPTELTISEPVMSRKAKSLPWWPFSSGARMTRPCHIVRSEAHLSGQRQRVGVEEGFVQGTDDQGQAGTWQCRGFPCVTRRRTPLLASSHRALFGFVAGCCSANAPHDDFDAISVAVARARPAAEVVPGGSFPIRAPLRPPEVGRASSSELHSRHEEHCER